MLPPIVLPITQNAFASDPTAEINAISQLLREKGFSSCGPDGLKLTAGNFNAVLKWLDDRMLFQEAQTDNVLTAIQDDSQILRFTDFDGNELVIDISRFTASEQGGVLMPGSMPLNFTQAGNVINTGAVLTITNPNAVYMMRGLAHYHFTAEWDTQGEGDAMVTFQINVGGAGWVTVGTTKRIQQNSDYRFVSDSGRTGSTKIEVPPSGSLTLQLRSVITTTSAFQCSSQVVTYGSASMMLSNSQS